ncbi:hypothetical protein A6A04_11150 [Paramagnetospirillum marisnigri]|uniref:histidine kinase n=2 Tax=Paramagnetospirillum marisnigri TaxID=1285242 RepID=A0A178MWJ9_9PROT|nr:hypothetical protein A6A04_11150 [Paramagnetospirillum marisnigri]
MDVIRAAATRLWVAVVMLAALVPPPSPAMAQPVEAKPPASITVVIDDNYPPYIFRTADGSLHGLLKDLWDLWGAKTGIKVELQAMDWARAQALMAAGKADVIDTLFETPARLQVYDFSKAYATIDVPIYFHSTISGISDADTLRGFTVGVKDGDACIDWLESRQVTSLRRYPSYESMVDAAGRHELRVFCLDQPPADYLLYKKGIDAQFRHTAPLYSGQFHWAVHKGKPDLYRRIEAGFALISPSEREAITTRWLGSPLAGPDSRYVRLITLGLQAAAGGAVVLAIWTWLLRRQVGSRTRQVVAALDALKSSEQHYRELVGLTPVGVFETDPDGRHVFVNDRWSRITGLSAEAALGLAWTDCVDAEDRGRVTAEWQAVKAERGLFQSEFRFPRPDGGTSWVLGQARAKRDVTGQVIGHIGTITDISAAKAAEAALSASEARFRTIFDAISDAIFIHDLTSGAILAVNQRMLEMYGYDTAAQVQALRVGQLSEGTAPYDDDAARQWIVRAASGETQLFEWRARKRDGSLFWVEVNMRSARISGVDRLLVVVRDVSERKEAERILTERTEALERSNADLEQFAYVASHDLREPLRMVSSYMALLERRYGDKLDKDGHDFIAFAKEGAVRMDRLVQDLLEFSRVGRINDPPTAVALDVLTANVLRVLRPVIAEAGARVNIPTSLPVVVCCGNEVFLLFQNLISNAIKFRSPERAAKITVTAERDGDAWRFTVADNGIGIEPDYYDRIFKIFHRLHTREQYDGTGIGLSICKKIVERHGGRIWVESTPGQGTRFHFTLGDMDAL